MDVSQGRFVVFEAAGTRAAMAAGAVVEILPTTRLERPPGAPAVLSGFMNLGGRPLAVISARALFDAASDGPPELYAHILRLARPADEPALGLLVDRVTDAGSTAQGAVDLDESQTLNGLFAANLLIDGRVTPLIEVDRLLLKEEALRIAAQAAAAQARLAGWSQEPA